MKLPSTSTVHCILHRHELVKKRRARTAFRATATYLSDPTQPNDLWCVGFKGQFRMRNGYYCYPLTISDFVSRYLITCEALDSTAERPCFAVEKTLLISNCGRVLLRKLKIHVSKAFSNQPVGLKRVDQGIWQVDFMSYTQCKPCCYNKL